MTPDPQRSERTHFALWQCVFGTVMLVGGLVLTRLGGFADVVGLLLMFFGVSALGLALLYGTGLAKLPETDEQRSERSDDDDTRS